MNIYLDNAASTPMDPEALKEMNRIWLELPGNPSSSHIHGQNLKAELEHARRSLASLIGASPAEIYFTSGGTEADNLAIRGSVSANKLRHIITTRIEHHAVSHVVEHLEKEETVTVTWLQPDSLGHIDYDELEQALKDHPGALVSLMHGNNEIGTLHDIVRIGELCKASGAIYHSDTVQAVHNLRYDLSKQYVNFITASAHKFNGPKGTGFLYIRKGTRINPMLIGGGHEKGMRPGTENVAAIVGMVYALGKSLNNLEEKTRHVRGLKDYMMSGLRDAFEGVDFNGDTSAERSLPNVLNVAFPCGDQDAMLVFNLNIAGISVSGGSACSSGAVRGSHVLAGIGCSDGRAINSVRFSFGMQNTREEIDEVIDRLKHLVGSQIVV